jgi:response regulator RpfG family c-di-GMP phosphodiesterase
MGEVTNSVVDPILTRVREELGMDVAYLTEFGAQAQTIRQVSSAEGGPIGIEEGLEVQLAESYCQRVVDGRLPSVVPDTAQNPVTRDLAVTDDAGIGAYVGVPVRFPDGALYGTLCCVSGSDRPELAERDIAFMQVLSRMLGDIVGRERSQAERERVLEGAMVGQRTELRATTARLAGSEAELVRRLSMAVEYRDDDTGAHVERVSRLCGDLAARAGLGAAASDLMRHASPLHDVGKVAIPDAVLLKPGRLTDEERAVIETHAQLGYELLRGSASDVLRLAATIAWSHHERYDGAGYPRRLAGEEIPVEGRIVAIVDVFDALSSDRVYRPAFPPERVEAMMREGHGTQFDPDLLDLFLADGDVAPAG